MSKLEKPEHTVATKNKSPRAITKKNYLSQLSLEVLDKMVCVFDDLLFLMSLPHPASPARVISLLEKHREAREMAEYVYLSQERDASYRHRVHNMLYRLRKDGLIEDTARGISITARGKKKLEQLRRNQNKAQLYAPVASKELCFVIFDIPEIAKAHRNWLRSVLKNLGFTMLQKSVWVGKLKIPAVFFEDLAERRLADYVRIFTISKTGSIDRAQ
jgi:hypothetical protein